MTTSFPGDRPADRARFEHVASDHFEAFVTEHEGRRTARNRRDLVTRGKRLRYYLGADPARCPKYGQFHRKTYLLILDQAVLSTEIILAH